MKPVAQISSVARACRVAGWSVKDKLVLVASIDLERAASRGPRHRGRIAHAAKAGAAAIAAEPLRESAAETLIDAEFTQRNRYEAVQCLRSFAHRLDRELGIAPDAALRQCVGGLGCADRATH